MGLFVALKNAYWRWRLRRVPVAKRFSAELYARLHRDVGASGMDGRVHYLRFGRAEGREPHPDFSASGYLLANPDAKGCPDPLLHFEQVGEAAGFEPLPEWEGERDFIHGRGTWLVCAHQVGYHLYGAERSLLDILTYLSEFDLNIVVALPGALNHEYLRQVRRYASQVAVLPYGWWRHGVPPLEPTQRHFEQLLQRYNCNAVYVNTSVLDEPLRAAKALGITTLVHVRELPAEDAALCAALGATPEQIRAHVSEWADVIVTNSQFTAECLGLSGAIVVPNSIDVGAFQSIERPVSRGEAFSVGLISSNAPKKGVDDLVAVAQRLVARQSPVRCKAIGPETDFLSELRAKTGLWPKNLELVGYCPTPEEAVGHVDVVLNLSHCYESFGRTVLEAMAARRPVVAYDRGALSELVADGVTGSLIPYSGSSKETRVEAVVDAIEALFKDADRYHRLGETAHRVANERYSPEATKRRLQQLVEYVSTL